MRIIIANFIILNQFRATLNGQQNNSKPATSFIHWSSLHSKARSSSNLPANHFLCVLCWTRWTLDMLCGDGAVDCFGNVCAVFFNKPLGAEIQLCMTTHPSIHPWNSEVFFLRLSFFCSFDAQLSREIIASRLTVQIEANKFHHSPINSHSISNPSALHGPTKVMLSKY